MGKKTLTNAHCLIGLIVRVPVSVLKIFSDLAECQALNRGFDWSKDETTLCASLLVADDVGLGKTIETGLVIQELPLLHRIRMALIVCPSSLQIQWREQMRDKLGLDFRIVDSELMKELRRKRGLLVDPWSYFSLSARTLTSNPLSCLRS